MRRFALLIGLVMVAAVLPAGASWAAASPAYPVCTVAPAGGDYTSLTTAIGDVNCMTIEVAAGTYAEGPQVVINRNLSIVGEDRATTIFNPTANTGNSGDARGWFLVQAGANVDVSNVTFDGTGFAIWQAFRSYGSGTIDTVAFVNIATQATGSPYNGIGVVGFGALDITNSTFQSIGRVGASYFGAGTGTFSGNTYTGKGVGDHIDYGVEVGGGAQVTIADNTISGNRGVAVVDGSGSGGILVSTYFGPGSAAAITGNTIQDNSIGVYIGYNAADSSAVDMEDNMIKANNYGIVVASGATAAAAASSANRNEITGNSTRGVWADVAFGATCNWWGDHWGPSGAGPGVGDSVTATVGFLPWLITDDLSGECGGGIDSDGDGVFDMVDNCPFVKNRNQADRDGDGVGNVCDPDIDGDGVPNENDAYPHNPKRWVLDSDVDGVPDAVDNCPFVKNRNQADRDGDGVGDVCDPDIDGDGVPNDEDFYPYNPNKWEKDRFWSGDSDRDGNPDDVDNCPFVKNRNQADRDGDGVGNVCDPDIDGDGVPNENDAYPYNPNRW